MQRQIPCKALRRAGLTHWAVIACLLYQTVANAAPWTGRSLPDVLTEIRNSGVVLVYSDQLVNQTMIVGAEPRAGDLTARLLEALAPFGLTVQTTRGDVLVVTRAEPPSRPPSVLDAPPAPPPEIVIETSRYVATRAEQASAQRIGPAELRSMPDTNEDALRILQRLPGSAAAGLSARSHVRGGYEDEILVRFDGVHLFNPFHLKDFLGLFGLIDPELVGSIDYYGGGFPASYGNRSSAVMDIHPVRNSESKNLLSVSELFSRAVTSGSFAEQRGEWLAGYRRSNLSLVLNALDRDVGKPNFEDLFARGGYEINDRVKITAGVLGLRDRLDLSENDRSEQVRADYSDTYVWASLESAWTDWLTNRTQLTHAILRSQRNGTSQHANISDGTLNDTRDARIDTITANWKMRSDSGLSATFGFELNEGEAQYNYVGQAHFYGPLAAAFSRPPVFNRRFVANPEGWQYAAHLSTRAEFGQWDVEVGLRWDDESFVRDAERLSPRLAARYQFDAETTLRLSTGRYVQSQTINELGLDENTFRFAAPDSLRQLVIGFDRKLSSTLDLRIEAYKKWIDDVRPRYENVLNLYVLLPDLEVDRVRLTPQKSQAHGVELSLISNKQSSFDWWLSLVWSEVTDRLNGNTLRRSWDQRYALNGGFSYTYHRWQMGTNFAWHTGWPYTPLSFVPSDTGGYSAAVVGARNSRRFSNYSSLDIKGQYALPLERGSLEFFAEVRNALNHENECCRNVSIEEQPDGDFGASVRRERWLSTVPIAGMNWRF